MSDDDTMGIEGIQEAQQANLRAIAVMETHGLGRAIQFVLPDLHRYAVSITHVWVNRGGALRASHRMSIEEGDDMVRGSIFLDPHAVNPRGQKPSEYGPFEEARGGDHAFYLRTMVEHGPRAMGRLEEFVRGMADG